VSCRRFEGLRNFPRHQKPQRTQASSTSRPNPRPSTSAHPPSPSQPHPSHPTTPRSSQYRIWSTPSTRVRLQPIRGICVYPPSCRAKRELSRSASSSSDVHSSRSPFHPPFSFSITLTGPRIMGVFVYSPRLEEASLRLLRHSLLLAERPDLSTKARTVELSLPLDQSLPVPYASQYTQSSTEISYISGRKHSFDLARGRRTGR